MKTLLTGVLILLVSFASCILRKDGAEEATPPGSASDGQEASLEQLSRDVETLKQQVAELSAAREDMKAWLRAEIEARLADAARGGGAGPAASVGVEEQVKLEWAKTISENSDVVRMWSGAPGTLEMILFPMTKGDDVEKMNRELGGEYTFLYMRIVNNSKDLAWTFKPKKGLVVAEVENADGTSPYILCRDPLDLIEERENTLGASLAIPREHFRERILRPGEVMETHVVFEGDLDFGKVKKIHWGTLVIPEIVLPPTD